jgi:hypothetical protein
MPDVQILRTAIGDTPVEYVVPGAAEFTLKAVYAEFVDNGAAGSWVPCLTIRSDSNHIVAMAIDEGIVVGAGDDAEVSWFPYVKRSGGSASSGLPFLILQGVQTTVSNPGVGDDDHGKFDVSRKFTNAASTWAYTLDALGQIKQVDLAEAGLYHAYLQYKWEAAGAAYERTTLLNVISNVNETYNGVTMGGVSPDDRVTTLDVYDGVVTAVFPISASGGRITVEPSLRFAGSHNFTPTYLTIVKHLLT